MSTAEAKATLVAQAKTLGIKGVLVNMSIPTLEKKIAEAKASLAPAQNNNNGELRKFAKFQKDKN